MNGQVAIAELSKSHSVDLACEAIGPRFESRSRQLIELICDLIEYILFS